MVAMATPIAAIATPSAVMIPQRISATAVPHGVIFLTAMAVTDNATTARIIHITAVSSP